ncbi:adhesion G-protein coupled receptor G2 isoform 2-T2 [Discoglossus pictus]
MHLDIHRMVPCDLQPVRNGKTARPPGMLHTINLLCLFLCILIMPQTAYSYDGEYKAVFRSPCAETMLISTTVPALSQFTLCTYIKLDSSNPWTAFTYKLPGSSSYELGLLGDSSRLVIWMFGMQISVSETLNLLTWYETCIRWDSKSKNMFFYLDGKVTVTQKLDNGTSLTGGGVISLGCSEASRINASSAVGLVGELYMFRIWKSAVNPASKKCEDGDIINWQKDNWIFVPSVIQLDLTLDCAKKISATTLAPTVSPATKESIKTTTLAPPRTPAKKESVITTTLTSTGNPVVLNGPVNLLFEKVITNLSLPIESISVSGNHSLSIDEVAPDVSTPDSIPGVPVSTTPIKTTDSVIRTTKKMSITTSLTLESAGVTGHDFVSTLSSSTASNESTVVFTSSIATTSNISIVECPQENVCNVSDICGVPAVYVITFVANVEDCFNISAELNLSENNSSSPTDPSPTALSFYNSPTDPSMSKCTVFVKGANCTQVYLTFANKTHHYNLSIPPEIREIEACCCLEEKRECIDTVNLIKCNTSVVLENCVPGPGSTTSPGAHPSIVPGSGSTTAPDPRPTIGSGSTTAPDPRPTIGSGSTTAPGPRTTNAPGPGSTIAPRPTTAPESHVTITDHIRSSSKVPTLSGGSGTPISKPSPSTSTSIQINTSTTDGAVDDLKKLNKLLASGNLNASIVDSMVTHIENLLSGEVKPEVARELVGVLNSFLNISQDLITPVSKRLLMIVDKIGLTLTFPEQSINFTSDSLALAVNKVNSSDFTELSFGVELSSGLQVSLGSQAPSKSDGSIILPASLLDNLPVGEKDLASRVQFNFFDKTSLFMDSSLAKNQYLVSKVISSSVGNLSISNLPDNVTVTLTTTHSEDEKNISIRCVFWDFAKNNGTGGWEANGCVVANSTHNETVCKCNHLTSFAILMDVTQSPFSPEDTLIMTFISYVGCGLSAIFLSVTLVTYIAFEKIRRDYPSKILIQLCAALVFLNLTFLLDPWISLYNDIPGLCISVAAFLHYFLLVSITWMGLEAFHMYLSLVKVFNTYVRKYILKFCIIGWGFPAVVVAIVLAINKDFYGIHTSGKYPNGSSDEFCWIQDIVFYITVVGYFCIIFLLNISMFIVVLIQLCRIKKKKQLGYQRKTTFQDMRSVSGITFLLGITWGLAFFSWGPGRVVIAYMFTIFNTLQGFFIFIFYCVAKENVRKQWRRYLCCGKFRLAENSDWSKTATNKLGKQASKQGVSSSSSNSIQSSSNSNSTTLLVANEYSMHPNGNGNAFKERNGVSFALPNGAVPLHDIPAKQPIRNGDAQHASLRRTSNRGGVHFIDQI